MGMQPCTALEASHRLHAQVPGQRPHEVRNVSCFKDYVCNIFLQYRKLIYPGKYLTATISGRLCKAEDITLLCLINEDYEFREVGEADLLAESRWESENAPSTRGPGRHLPGKMSRLVVSKIQFSSSRYCVRRHS